MIEKSDIVEIPILVISVGLFSVSFIGSLILTSALYILYVPFYLIKKYIFKILKENL